MNGNSKIGAALVGGYLLGRTKKAKAAIGLGMFLAGRKLDLDPRRLAKLAADSPVIGGLSDQVRKQLVDGTKSALTSAVTNRANSLADSLHRRTSALNDPAQRGGSGREKAGGGEDEDGFADEEYEDAEYAGDEAPDDEIADDETPADEERPRPRRAARTGTRKAAKPAQAAKSAKAAEPAKSGRTAKQAKSSAGQRTSGGTGTAKRSASGGARTARKSSAASSAERGGARNAASAPESGGGKGRSAAKPAKSASSRTARTRKAPARGGRDG